MIESISFRFTLKSESSFVIDHPHAVLYACFCPRHFRMRKDALLAALCFAVGAVTFGISALCFRLANDAWMVTCAVTCLLALLGVSITAFIGMRGPRLHRFRGGYLYLRGLSLAFLDGLPDATGKC